MFHREIAKILKEIDFCIFYRVDISNFHKSILYCHKSHKNIFAMNRMSLYGILILHIKHSWSVLPVISDFTYKVALLTLASTGSELLVNRYLKKMLFE